MTPGEGAEDERGLGAVLFVARPWVKAVSVGESCVRVRLSCVFVRVRVCVVCGRVGGDEYS